MSFEQFRQMLLRQRESERQRNVPQLGSFEVAADAEEDVGAVRLSRLQAALKERRDPESEG
ncbi:MAG: hypothetical protein ACREU7_08860 [Burkholderiales bacterium]